MSTSVFWRLSALALAASTWLAAASRVPAPSPGAEGPPDWLVEHMRFVTDDGGRWVADNSAYESADEPFDAYGMEWTWGLGRTSQRGRMFALREGEEVATVWELLVYWHPGEGAARTWQIGADGTLATGELRRVEDGELEAVDVFHAPDGTQRSVRHEVWCDGDEWAMQAWDRRGEEWVEARAYVWERQR